MTGEVNGDATKSSNMTTKRKRDLEEANRREIKRTRKESRRAFVVVFSLLLSLARSFSKLFARLIWKDKWTIMPFKNIP